jgi:tRNA-2-methylthio-N6-dimethylallyladenosine synthase
MNVYDSGRLAALLESRGWGPAPSGESADFIFLNTCSIREKAVQRVIARLRELAPLKRARPGLIIGVGGCVAEQEGLELVRKIPALDIVAGPRRLEEIPRALEAFAPGGPPIVMGGDPPEVPGRWGLAPEGWAAVDAPSGGLTDAPPAQLVVPSLAPGRAIRPSAPQAAVPAAAGVIAAPDVIEGAGAPPAAAEGTAGPPASAEGSGAPPAAGGVPEPAGAALPAPPYPALSPRGSRKPLLLAPCEAAGPAPLSALVTVMEGCDNFCAYCVVPGLRGPERSRPPGDVLAETRSLVSRGAREITFLGQNVNSYSAPGLPGGGRGGAAFARILEEASGIPGLWRLRFTTSHPKDFPQELPRLMADLPALCPHIHLPLQAGSDRVLSLMGRRYTAAGYMGILEALRSRVPEAAVTTDIIVGFPGETEEDFAMTLRILEEASFDSIFSFKYSDRPGTRALSMPGKVPEEVKARRLEEVIRLQRGISLRINRALEGSVQEILVAGPGREPGQLSGRTGTFKIVNFQGTEALVGGLSRVRITGSGPVSLRGEIVAGVPGRPRGTFEAAREGFRGA